MKKQESNSKPLSLIDKNNLGDKVVHLAFNKKLSHVDISEHLKEEGFPISPISVGNWLRKQTQGTRDDLKSIFSKHVKEKLPSDLSALEGLEQEWLVWAHETKREFDKKLVSARVDAILPDFDRLRVKFLSTTIGTPRAKAVLKDILNLCMDISRDEYTHRKFRLLAGKQAASVIQTKLAFSGILDGAGSGNIIIKPYGTEIQPGGKSLPGETGANLPHNKVVKFRGKNG
ncbi:MAG: hypothetical protein ABIL06_13235 [Pseudomonadota bacterium]|uniref:Uncharacterized protein n=1 Tax=viral metagenome TaxID=1070528 RepID=A0A6H1ZHK4_9ZZZZ